MGLQVAAAASDCRLGLSVMVFPPLVERHWMDFHLINQRAGKHSVGNVRKDGFGGADRASLSSGQPADLQARMICSPKRVQKAKKVAIDTRYNQLAKVGEDWTGVDDCRMKKNAHPQRSPAEIELPQNYRMPPGAATTIALQAVEKPGTSADRLPYVRDATAVLERMLRELPTANSDGLTVKERSEKDAPIPRRN